MRRAVEEKVRSRGVHRCEYCHLPERFSRLRFAIDHIIAKQHAGEDEIENLAFCCGFCNRHKGPNLAGIDPQTRQMSRLFHPRQDRWEDHFEWMGSIVKGLTLIGRATIEVLAMNHPYQVAVRQALIDEGVF